MLEKFNLFTVLIILVVCQSCTRSTNLLHYAPIDGNGLKLEKKKDLKLSASGNAPHFPNQFDTYIDFQLAYSPIKNIGIQTAQFIYRSAQASRNENKLSVQKIALGGYHNLVLKDSSYHRNYFSHRLIPKRMLFELYGGTSFGQMDNKASTVFSSAEIHRSSIFFRKYFIRGSYHLQYKRIGMSITSKFGVFDYFKGNLKLGPGETPVGQHFVTIANKDRENFWESSFRFSFGKQNLKSYLGLTTLSLGDKTNIFSREKMLYLGVTLDLGSIRKSLNQLRIEE